MSVDPTSFRQVMAQFASGVTVVTTEHEGAVYGMTVAAFSSVSLDPPLVLVCIAKTASSREPIALARKFGVHVLGADQEKLGARFAGKNTMAERFDGLTWKVAVTGSPILDGCLAYVDCELSQAHDAGDHMIFVGHVVAASARDVGDALIHFRRAFWTPAPLRSA